MAWLAVNEIDCTEEMMFAIKPSRFDDSWWIASDIGFSPEAGEQFWITIGDRTFVGDDIDDNRQLIKDIAHVSFERNHIGIPLPNGSINKLIGRTLTWEDEPVEI